MMDLHILIVISCVVLASLFSLLFINKFFRRKTFEEIIAEKKALNEKIYQSKAAAATTRKPKKVQQLKKEQKREKKQRQKEQHKDNTEQEDSDAQSEQASVEEEPQGLSKTHVEFEPDPEVVTYNAEITTTRSNSTAEKENVGGGAKPKSKKDKKSVKTAGILVNKNEPLVLKENLSADEQLNTFEIKAPKDVLELKKQEKEKKEDKPQAQQQQQQKKEKAAKKEKHVPEKTAVVVEPVVEVAHVAKELKQQDEKTRQGSPKNQQHTNNKSKQNKKQNKENNAAASKDSMLALDKLSGNDTIGVSVLMNLFRHAELNRSEIQILIDYLLNKQQDMPTSHSEWSDDICQKLKRQLEEKERALTEEQEASIGIQAKLRELRTEINTERAQMNATIKAYTEKIQSKEQEITGLNQEMQTLNDKIAVERQQFQAKLVREKQAGSQDLLQQLQLMQNELTHKDKCIGELTCMVNASRQAVDDSQQKNDIIQTQVQQIRALEQQREELEQISNNRIFELEQAKTIETENGEIKVELLNLQNAIESAKTDAAQACKELEAVKTELTLARNVELREKQQEIQLLQAQINDLTQQLAGYSGKAAEQFKEQSSLQVTLDAVKQQLAEKGQQLAEFNAMNAELKQQVASAQAGSKQQIQQQQDLQHLIETLKTEVAGKHQQLQEVQQSAEQVNNRQQELLQQLQEQKEKNNDLRMKNWKLVEALQNAETIKQNKAFTSANASLVQQEQLLAATQKATVSGATAATESVKEQQQIRELFQRLCPDAVKACASSALSASLDQWVEQVLATHIKQETASKTNATSGVSNKSTQSSNSAGNSNHNTHNSHTNNNLLNSEATNNSNSRNSSNNSSNSNSSSSDVVDVHKVCTENAQLRIKIDELTNLVTKTSNTLLDLEKRAREQDANWRSIVSSKEDQIILLQHSNGKQDI